MFPLHNFHIILAQSQIELLLISVIVEPFPGLFMQTNFQIVCHRSVASMRHMENKYIAAALSHAINKGGEHNSRARARVHTQRSPSLFCRSVFNYNSTHTQSNYSLCLLSPKQFAEYARFCRFGANNERIAHTKHTIRNSQNAMSTDRVEQQHQNESHINCECRK